MSAISKGAIFAALAWSAVSRGTLLNAQLRGGLPTDGTPSLILDFVNSTSSVWPVLALDFLSPGFQVDDGDATVGGEPINIQVWS